MSWARYCVQLQKDLRLWGVLVAFLVIARLFILLACHRQWEETTDLSDVYTAAGRGLRFDIQLVTVWCAVSFLISGFCGVWDWTRFSDRLRIFIALSFALMVSITFAIDIAFFREYHQQFNHYLFGILYDDRSAIAGTVWTHYHPVAYMSGALTVAIGLSLIGLRAARRPFLNALTISQWHWSRPLRIGFIVLLIFFFICAARGSIARRPLQMKDAAAVADPCLNAWIPTPMHAFSDALNTWENMQDASGIDAFIPGGDLISAAASVFPEHGRQSQVEDYLLRHAPGATTPPRHIFLIIMESYDAWPLLKKWQPLHLTDQVAALGAEGILVTDFLPIGGGTMSSLGAILTGLPDAGVYTAFRPSARSPFASSPAAIFKRLGYRTQFFYAGYLSWQRIGDFCSEQGFDHVYGGGHIGNPRGNEWGVDDKDLFRFVLNTVTNDEPTFNVILTTSNHPPYQVNIDREGFPLTDIPSWTQYDPAGNFTREILGHLWYSDRSAGDFIRAVESRLPRTVIALTGDHWSRRSMTARPSCYERSAVPFLLHGPEVLAHVAAPSPIAGGHLDIAPTLIELCAPAGFAYHALGENLLRPHHYRGLGYNRVITPHFIVELDGAHPIVSTTNSSATPSITDAPLPNPDEINALVNWHQTAYGLGWWRLMHGSSLKKTGD